jgi:hypothetical protein
MHYINPTGGFANEASGGPVTILAPATGTVLPMRGLVRDAYIVGPLAALTLALPQVKSGEIISLYFSGVIGALVLTDHSGNAIPTAPTATTAGESIEMRYIGKPPGGATIGWVRWR